MRKKNEKNQKEPSVNGKDLLEKRVIKNKKINSTK